MNRLVNSIVGYWVKEKIITEEDSDIYIYGVDLAISTVLNILTVLLLALAFDRISETIPMLLVVIPLQSCCGGYHAETHLNCFLIMVCGWFIVMSFFDSINAPIAIAIAVLSYPIIFLLSPVPHKNMPMTPNKHKKMKRRSRVLGGVALVASFLPKVGIPIAVGIGIIAISMLAAGIKAKVESHL